MDSTKASQIAALAGLTVESAADMLRAEGSQTSTRGSMCCTILFAARVESLGAVSDIDAIRGLGYTTRHVRRILANSERHVRRAVARTGRTVSL